MNRSIAFRFPGFRTPALTAAFTLVVLLVIGLPVAQAQIPEEFTNLKVLPEDISKGELVGIMRGMAGGLGVRCNHCHQGPDNLQGMDFATDDKESKRTARAMMIMMNAINKDHLAKLETERTEVLEGMHRGVAASNWHYLTIIIPSR